MKSATVREKRCFSKDHLQGIVTPCFGRLDQRTIAISICFEAYTFSFRCVSSIRAMFGSLTCYPSQYAPVSASFCVFQDKPIEQLMQLFSVVWQLTIAYTEAFSSDVLGCYGFVKVLTTKIN